MPVCHGLLLLCRGVPLDPVTHVLAPALWSEPVPSPEVAPAVYARWRERAAVALGALLPDADGVLGWIDLSLYDRYHRVVTHSVPGLLAVTLLAAGLAATWPERWILPFLRTRAQGQEIVRPTARRLLSFAALAVALHFVGDLITAWGIWPAWPWSAHDFALARVNSLEPALCGITLGAWALQHWLLTKGRRRAAWGAAVAWLLVCAVYVAVRPALLGEPYI